MPHVLDADAIRRKLNVYLAGKISLTVFHKWFVPATWDIADPAPQSLRELIYEIKLRLAEYTGGYLTEQRLREKLAALTSSFVVTFAKGAKPLVSRRIVRPLAVESRARFQVASL